MAANGILLPKPVKKSYIKPTIFRIIVLLETISKILEPIVTFCLYNYTIQHNLIHPSPGGSAPGSSTSDAAATLTHVVKLLQAMVLKVASLFHDIKGGFDNVTSHTFATNLRAHKTPSSIVNCVLSFLSNRSCRLLFKGGSKTF
jgi:hypothetical protein